MSAAFELIAATGNRFAVLDGFRAVPPEDLGPLAVALCAEHALDGVLVVAPARDDGDCRMLVVNRDGSRAEACGNGLRCVAKLASERGHVAGELLRVETDAGVRRVRVLREGGRVVAAEAELGRPRLVGRGEELALGDTRHAAWLVDMGNPHCVLFVADVASVALERLGPALERHPRFPARTNVEIVAVRTPARLDVRIHERGVGETASCGTGVGAAAAAALERGLVGSPVTVLTRGGALVVTRADDGTLLLRGPVESFSPAAARRGDE